MKEDQAKCLEEAIEKLTHLQTEFRAVATAAKENRSIWPKRYSNSVTATTFNIYADLAEEAVTCLKTGNEHTTPLLRLSDGLRASAIIAAENAEKKRFSLLKRQDKKDTAQFEELTQKVSAIFPLIRQARRP